jgi:phage repressor protein C with HTH and peptisase S24 domain/DNA-binding XRE family transcriptional regulator
MRNDVDRLRELRQQVERQLTTSQEFGTRLRQLRQERDMTLDTLAAESDISKAYLSQIETGRVDPPRDEKIRRLEEVFGLRPGTLLELAHLARTPDDVRARLELLQQAVSRSEEALFALRQEPDGSPGSDSVATSPRGAALAAVRAGDQAATALPSSQTLSAPRPVVGRIPIINRVAAGRPAEFTDLDYPPGVADDYLSVPPGLDDPNAFAVRVDGDSMEPRYHQGDVVIFSPAAEVASGHDCYVRFAPECSVAQGATFKRVYFDTQTTVRLQPLNDRYPPLVAPLEEVSGIYRALFRYEAL